MSKALCIILVSCMLAIGCAGIKNVVCTPNADQAIVYAQQLVEASQMLTYFQSLAPTTPLQAIITGLQTTIAIIKQAQAGVCVDVPALAAAQQNIDDNKLLAKSLKSGKQLRVTN